MVWSFIMRTAGACEITKLRQKKSPCDSPPSKKPRHLQVFSHHVLASAVGTLSSALLVFAVNSITGTMRQVAVLLRGYSWLTYCCQSQITCLGHSSQSKA